MTLQREADAAFYRSVHHSLAGSSARRTKTIQFEQAIAPCRPGERPPASRFFSVLCTELSREGITIFLPAAPDFAHLVLQLGVEPRVKFLSAEVVQVTPPSGAHGDYRILCRFTGRLSAPLSR